MGSLYSTPTPGQKPASVMPQVGCGTYSETGCADLMISFNTGDGSGNDECSPEDEGVFARIFYPTRLKSDDSDPGQAGTATPEEYPMWRPRREYLDGLADYRNSNSFYIHFFFDWILGGRRLCSGWQQPLASGGKFPVVVFSHGISGHRSCYSTYCASLASYGFVVAAIEHRDRSASWSYYLKESTSSEAEGKKMVECPVLITTFPEGEKEFKERNRQLHIRVHECINTLDVLDRLNTGLETNNNTPGMRIVYGGEFDWNQFKGRLDIDRASIIGHSMGGASAIAVQACTDRFKSSVILDGWLYPIERDLYQSCNGRPILMLNASKWQWAENVKRMFKLDGKESEKILLTIKDIVHQSFSDFSFLKPGYIGKKFRVQGEHDPCYTGGAILELTVAFLTKCLNGEKAHDDVLAVMERYKGLVIEGTDIDLGSGEEESDGEVVHMNKDAESSGEASNM